MQALKIKRSQRLINTSGLGAMGFAIPSAIGVCVANKNNQVICI